MLNVNENATTPTTDYDGSDRLSALKPHHTTRVRHVLSVKTGISEPLHFVYRLLSDVSVEVTWVT